MFSPTPRIVFTALCLLGSLAFALPTGSSEDVLAKLEGRAACSQDNCYRMFSNADPLTASAYCQSYITSTPGTVTVTAMSFATSISTPAAQITTVTSGTTTVTVSAACTQTITNTNLYKRAASTTPFSAKASSSCTSNQAGAPTARISSACSCLLTSVTTTVTPISTIVAPTPAVSTVTVPANTATSTVCTSLSAVTTSVTEPYSCQNIPSPFMSYGRSFTSICNQGWGYSTRDGSWLGDIYGITSFKPCLDLCAQNSQCKYFTWVRAPYNHCTLLSNMLEGDRTTFSDSGYVN